MSGGSFNYLVYKEPQEMLVQTDTLREMEEWLREQNRHAAADELYRYRLELETYYRRLTIQHRRMEGLLKAAEWAASSDWGIESVDRAYDELSKPKEETIDPT